MLLTKEEIKELRTIADLYFDVHGCDWGEVWLKINNVEICFWMLTEDGHASPFDGIYITVPRRGWWAELWHKKDEVYINLKEEGPWWDDIRKGMGPLRKELETEIQKRKDKRSNKVKDLGDRYDS